MFKVTDYAALIGFQKRKQADIGPVKQISLASNCEYFLIHQFKHAFWVLKITVSLSSFEYPQHMFWLRNEKIFFRGPVFNLNLNHSFLQFHNANVRKLKVLNSNANM